MKCETRRAAGLLGIILAIAIGGGACDPAGPDAGEQDTGGQRDAGVGQDRSVGQDGAPGADAAPQVDAAPEVDAAPATDGGPDAGSNDAGSLDDQAARLTAAVIGYMLRCINEDIGFLGEVEPTYVDRLFSEEAWTEHYRRHFLQIASSPFTSIDQAALLACETMLEAASCSEGDATRGCNDVLVGAQPEGGACNHDEECLGDSSCRGRTDTECGACTPRAALGERCEYADCALGDRCELVETTWICVERVVNLPPSYAAGDTCESNGARCDWNRTGLICLDENVDGIGVCTATTIAGEGEPCERSINGEWLVVCRHGIYTTHYCYFPIRGTSSVGTCRVRPGAGEACATSDDYCDADEAYCDTETDTCLAISPAGAACDPMTSPGPCGIFATCDDEDRVCRGLMDAEPEPTVICE